MDLNKLYLGDCLEVMPALEQASIDCVITDLPYGTTDNRWDVRLPMDELWSLWRRLLRPGGAMVLFTQQPFTTMVANSNLRQLKTEWIWEKPQGTGFLNAKKYPLKNHENVLVFCDRPPQYFPQKRTGFKPYKSSGHGRSSNYRTARTTASSSDDSRYPVTVLRPGLDHKLDRGLHPTQKPIALCDHLIRTYTSAGQTVLDCCAGSGSTLLAAAMCGRHYVGIERDPIYHERAKQRLAQQLQDSINGDVAGAENHTQELQA